MSYSIIIRADQLQEGAEVFDGRIYLVVEDVRPEGDKIRIEADGYVWHYPPERALQIAIYGTPAQAYADIAKQAHAEQVEAFLLGYMECAIWSSNDPETERPLDDKYSIGDINAELTEQMRQECAAFVGAHYGDLERFGELTGRDWGSHGHDLWLTRNRHGAGYWDRYLEAEPEDRKEAHDLGADLSKAAAALGEFYLAPTGEQVGAM